MGWLFASAPGIFVTMLSHLQLPRGLKEEVWASLPSEFQADLLHLLDGFHEIEGCDGFHLLELWAFGSCARGTARWGSDLDLLLIISDETTNPNPSLQAWRAFASSKASLPYDLVVVRQSEWTREQDNICTLFPDIKKDRKLLYARD